MRLSLRGRLTWCAHVAKACLKQHHRALIPVLRRLVPEDGVVFDVGGHAGQFAKLFAALAPEGHVYVFEPGSYALSVLRPAVRFNRLSNVTILPCALSDAPGEAPLSVPVKPSGSVGFGLSHVGAGQGGPPDAPGADRSYVEEIIRLRTLDEVVRTERIGRVDFVKADIEGWEMRMLAGAETVLSELRPVLMLEVVDRFLARAGDGTAALFGHLRERGYRPAAIDTRDGTLSELPGPRDGDIIFVPEEKAAEILNG